MVGEKRYTVILYDGDPEREERRERDLSWEQADHMMIKAIDHGLKVDWAEEVLQCPEGCLEGCYDGINFDLAHGTCGKHMRLRVGVIE